MSKQTCLPRIKPRKATGPKVSSFTLIELLVVIAIIALLISILLPSLKQAKEQAKAVVCQTNLKAIHTGFSLYAEDWEGNLPHVHTVGYTVGGTQVRAFWNEHLTVFEDSYYTALGSAPHYTAPVEYIEAKDVYQCPSADPDEDAARAFEPWPWGSGVPRWQYDIYGTYGMQNRMSSSVWMPSGYTRDTWYDFWDTNRADRMFLMAGSYMVSFDHYDITDLWYMMRHGSKGDLLHIMFQDAHVESYLEDDIPYGNQTSGLLPWWNEG